MCSPGRKGRADLTSSPPSSRLATAVPPECPARPDGNWRQGLRSLWHLSRHLTARADDNHAAPSLRPRRERASPPLSSAIQIRVRFLAYHRIKPHVPPLVRAPVNSFEFHRCRRTPQVECLTLSLGGSLSVANREHSSFTAWTTRVSNPVRSPRFRASASDMVWYPAFAIGVLCDIYAFHRYTTHSGNLRHSQGRQYLRQCQG